MSISLLNIVVVLISVCVGHFPSDLLCLLSFTGSHFMFVSPWKFIMSQNGSEINIPEIRFEITEIKILSSLSHNQIHGSFPGMDLQAATPAPRAWQCASAAPTQKARHCRVRHNGASGLAASAPMARQPGGALQDWRSSHVNRVPFQNSKF